MTITVYLLTALGWEIITMPFTTVDACEAVEMSFQQPPMEGSEGQRLLDIMTTKELRPMFWISRCNYD